MPDATADQVSAFIARWENSGAAERANYQMFLAELCDIIGVPRPDPTSPDPAKNLYVFDRAINRINPDGTTSTGFIDLYRRGSLVLESKQGTHAAGDAETNPAPSAKTGHGKRGTQAFDKALERAFHQARGYITALPPEEGRPPFLIACFNGGLFETTTALPLSAAQVAMLADAAATDWSGVEPSIFGTLLVRALDPRERHKLGAEFTPRSYVERLIRPIMRLITDARRVRAAKVPKSQVAWEAECPGIMATSFIRSQSELGCVAQPVRASSPRHKLICNIENRTANDPPVAVRLRTLPSPRRLFPERRLPRAGGFAVGGAGCCGWRWWWWLPRWWWGCWKEV